MQLTTPRRNARRLGIAATGTIAALLLAACAPGTTDPESTSEASPSETNTSAINADAIIEAGISYALGGSFDPLLASGAVTLAANWHIFEGLVDLDPVTREPYAALAADLPTKVDETTYQIDIRPGAVFQNGEPVTVEDVLFSYERVLNPDTGGFFTTFISFIESIEAVDEDTVELKTKFPFSLVNERLGVVKIVPKALVEADAEAFGTAPVGSGPYTLISAIPDDALTFERHEGYNGPRPALAAGMRWNLLSDPAARVTAMSSGTIQAMEDVPYIDVNQLTSLVDVETVQSFGLLFMMFNTKSAPFDDARVRQAFFYALDMDKIIDTGLLGNAEAASSFLPKSHPNYNEAANVFTYDPEKAKSLLAEAGVSDLSITLLTTDTGWVRDVAPLIKESLDAVGVDVTLDIAQSSAQYGKVDVGDYQVMVAPGDPSVFGNDPDILLRWWYGNNVWPNNRYYWADSPQYAELSSLLDQAIQLEGEAQQAVWNTAFDLLSTEVPLYPLFHRKLPTAWNGDSLVGFAPTPTTGLSFLGVGVAE